VHRAVADLGEAEHALDFGNAIRRFLRKLMILHGGLDEVWQFLPHRIFGYVTNSKPLLYVPRGAPLRNLIEQYTDQLEPQKFATVTTAVIDAASAGRTSAINDLKKYIDDVTLVLRDIGRL
jgi:hypothetical protein